MVVQKFLDKLHVRLLKSKLLARLLPSRSPPLLLPSFPRSGSSWAGTLLFQSPDVAYLREPINSAFRIHYASSLVDIEEDSAARRLYTEFSNAAFMGALPRGFWQVKSFKQLFKIDRPVLQIQ